MRKIIGIAGKARSGKDTIAAHLWTHYGFTRMAFADPVKLATQAAFGLSNEQTWLDEHKEVVIPFWGLSPRQMFQLMGTECVKPHFGNDIWVKRMILSLQSLPEDNIVIPDVRFEPEAEFIRANGGVIVHLFRGAAPAVNAHVSEAGIEVDERDYAIFNNGTIEELHTTIGAFVSVLMEDEA